MTDSRTARSTPSGGHRAGCDGAERRRGSRVHAAVDALGHPLALVAAPVDRGMVDAPGQEATGGSVGVAWVNREYAGERAAEVASGHGVGLEVVEHAGAQRGSVLLPRRRAAERSSAWAARFDG